MARFSESPEGGKFRASPATALVGTAGAWGDGDLLCVTLDAAGELIVAAAVSAVGVIVTTEGRRDSDSANFKEVQDKPYTVHFLGTLQDMEIGTSPALASGNRVYAAAAGDVVAGDAMPTGAGAGAVFIGWVLDDPITGGLKLQLNVGGWKEGAA